MTRWLAAAWSRAIYLVIAVLILGGVRPLPVSAHAALVRSFPAASASLTTPPERIEMWFTEPLEASFSTARLLDINGEEIPTQPAQVDPADPFHLILPLESLPPGLYTVAWQSFSQADGHEWLGSFPFTILSPDGTRPDGSLPDPLELTGEETPGVWEVVARWLLLAGSMLLFGLPLFRLVVVGTEREDAGAASLATLLEYLLRAGIVGALVGGVLHAVHQAQGLGGMTALAPLLTTTRAGQLALGRLLVILALAALPVPRLQEKRRWQLRLMAGALLLALISLGSHAAAVPGSLWAVLGDLVHLLAAAAWLAGLLVLPLVAGKALREPELRPILGTVVRRFSTMAAGAMVLLTATGLFSSAVELPSPGALVSTTYGQVLLVKLFLVALVLGVAALNRRLLQRRLSDPHEAGGWRTFTWQTSGEVVLALALLGSVAVLVQTTVPSKPVVEQSFEQGTEADDLTMHLQVTPNRVGHNRFVVHLYGEDDSPVEEVQLVRLLFNYQGEELGQAQGEMTPVTSTIFSLDGTYLNRAGLWEVGIYVRRRGADDVLATVPVEVLPAARAASPGQNPLPHVALPLVGATLLALVGLLALIWRSRVRRRYPRQADLILYAAEILLGLSLVLAWWQVTHGRAPTDPPTTAAAILRGDALYQENCAPCHGATGQGDGPLVGTLPSPPATLHAHVPAHGDRILHGFITRGLPRAGMPAFGERLTDEQIWSLVHYLRDEFGSQKGH